MTALLEARGLGKAFGALVVTDAVDLTLGVGARHALIGPNGAGKTTLVNLLTGELSPDRGSIRLLGEDVTAMAPDRRVRHGLVRTFQISQLMLGLSVLENVQCAILEREQAGASIRWARDVQRRAAEEAYDLLVQFGLGDTALKPVALLPYGHQRLVEVVVALSLRPKVLLLDEPAAGVPPADSARMMELIAMLPAEIGILIIEHDMDLVFRFARSITVLVQGSVMCQGSPQEIGDDPRVREIYLGSAAHG